MKFNKIYAIALAALTLTACSDDDDNGLNSTSGVTVQMQQSTMSVSEDMQQGVYYKVPIVVTGEANGPVEVTVEVQGTGTAPATEDEHYVITDKTITIDADTQIGYVEFYPKGDDVANDDRQFIVTITGAKGATVGTESTCIVTLVDNESLLPKAYEKIQGTYVVTADGEDPFVANVVGVAEGEEGYPTKLFITNFYDPDFVDIECTFSFDASTGKGLVAMPLGVTIGGPWNFGSKYGVCDVVMCSVNNGAVVTSGDAVATTDTEFTTFTFDKSLIGVLYTNPAGAFTGATYFWFDNCKFTKQ